MQEVAAAVPYNPAAPIENLLSQVPLCNSPIGRTAVFGALGGAFAYAVRPEMSFLPSGEPRKWIVTHGNDPQATLFPYWAYVALPALIFGVFI